MLQPCSHRRARRASDCRCSQGNRACMHSYQSMHASDGQTTMRDMQFLRWGHCSCEGASRSHFPPCRGDWPPPALPASPKTRWAAALYVQNTTNRRAGPAPARAGSQEKGRHPHGWPEAECALRRGRGQRVQASEARCVLGAWWGEVRQPGEHTGEGGRLRGGTGAGAKTLCAIQLRRPETLARLSPSPTGPSAHLGKV